MIRLPILRVWAMPLERCTCCRRLYCCTRFPVALPTLVGIALLRSSRFIASFSSVPRLVPHQAPFFQFHTIRSGAVSDMSSFSSENMFENRSRCSELVFAFHEFLDLLKWLSLPERQLFNFMLHGIPVLCHSAMLAQKAGAIPRLQSLRSIAHQMCIRNCANWSYVITMLGRPHADEFRVQV
jgi:hypothetical protein